MKRLLVLMTILTLSLSITACGEDKDSAAPVTETASSVSGADSSASVADTSELDELIAVTGNGLSFGLPIDIKYVKTDESNGGMIFSNDERTAVVTVGAKTEENITSADITDDVLLQVISGAGALKGAVLENSGTVEQFGGTAVVGFGKVTMPNETVMKTALQYFFPSDGGCYVISYHYAVDVETSLDANIERVMATVKIAE